jgi:hypothetical protein
LATWCPRDRLATSRAAASSIGTSRIR